MDSGRRETKPNRDRWRILPIVLLGPFMATLDSSIVNVAMPDMAQKLSVGIDSIQWVVTSYLIVISALVLIFGKIADLIGKSTVFSNGFILFSVGSLLCGISWNIKFLIFSRIVQGIGAAMTMSSNQGIIADTFPINERGRALGFSGTTVAVGTMLGPPVGGILVQFFSWHSIFLINIPIGLYAFFAGKKILPRDRRKGSLKNLDLTGSMLFIISTASIFWALSSGEKLGWESKIILFAFIVSIICFIIFCRLENSIQSPLMDFSMFRNKLFNVSLICAFISFVVLFCNNMMYPFYLQYAMKISPGTAGILMMTFPICAGIIAPISGYISDKIGGEILTLIGLSVTALGLMLLGSLTLYSNYFNIILGVAVLGIGNGLFQSPNNSLVMSLVSRDKLGIAGSINALVRNMGMIFGTAVSVAVLYNRMSYKMGYRVEGFIASRPEIFMYGMRIVYICAAVFCMFGMILTVFRLFKNKIK